MFILHAHAKIVSYHNFDRFIYAPGAILLATKICDEKEYATKIVSEFRNVVRARRGRPGTDSEDKLKVEVIKVKEAETNLIISIGFDMNIYCGHGWLM